MNHEEENVDPTLTSDGLSTIITWKDGVQITVDEIERGRDKHISCEIQIQDFNELGGSYILSPQRITLTRSPRQMLTDLKESSNRDIEEWKLKLRLLSLMIIKEYRTGQEIIDVNEMEIPEEPIDIVTGICYEGNPTLIYGEGGIGKSMMALTMATAVHNNVALPNGFNVKGGNALYLDYETNELDYARRGRMCIRGTFDNRGRIPLYMPLSAPIAQIVPSLRRKLYRDNITFLVIDSAGPACGGKPESAEDVLQYFTALRALKEGLNTELTTLTLGHVAKNQFGNSRNPFGSVYWVNNPRDTFELKRVQSKESNYMDVGMYHKKTNMGRLRDDAIFRVTFSGRASVVEPITKKESDFQEEGDGYIDRVMEIFESNDELAKSGMTLADLKVQLELPEDNATLQPSMSRDTRVYSQRVGANWLWFPNF